LLAGALGTYSAALFTIAVSTAIGAGICAAGGARRWTWTAPAIGLAAASVLAWWAVRLPGHGLTTLVVLAAAAAVGGALALRRLGGLGDAAARGAPAFATALVAVSIPFAVEGHFGVLGSGFNVDMSQHLFAASWLTDPSAVAPGLYEQGYPLGPHALAVATGEVSGELATSFSGVTIAAPVLLALTCLAACGGLPRWRATIVAALAALAYLAAGYLAQGSFKELYEVTFVVGFALWLAELRAGGPLTAGSWRAGLAPAVLAAGALYAYSGPGLAWLAGTLVLWTAFELVRGYQPVAAQLRRGLPALGTGLVALLLLAAPELDRIIDFGGSVGTVSDEAEAATAPSVLRLAGADELGADEVRAQLSGQGRRDGGLEFDNDLGNLFGQISPLEAFGVWPSGDFRVAPGDGAVPAVVFYAGALLGALGLGLGVVMAARRGETALLAALAAAVAIWLAARIASTPYTTAKALEMVAPVAMLIAARGLLDPAWLTGLRGREQMLRAAASAAFVGAAALSSGLALANAPVGPAEYGPGVRALSQRFAGEPTLLLAPRDVVADQHGSEFYGWELREASPGCVAASPGRRLPPRVRLVVEVDGGGEPPFDGLSRLAETDGALLWRVEEPDRSGDITAVGDGGCLVEPR